MVSWSYIAGFFDGEGSITHNGRGFRVTIPQTNLGVLLEIKKFTGVGYVIKIAKRRAHWKTAWIFYVASQRDVRSFLRRVQPNLILKRTRIARILKKLDRIVSDQRRRHTIAQTRKLRAKYLRQSGLSYRAIGRAVGIDWGYARRIILGRRR